MTKTKIHKSYFQWKNENYMDNISEKSVDKILAVLKLDPDCIFLPKGEKPSNITKTETLKEHTWRFLASVIGMYGKESDTDLGANAESLRDKTGAILDTLYPAIYALKALRYDSLYIKSSSSADVRIANKIRETAAFNQAIPCKPVSDDIKIEEYKKNGYWGRYCDFDNELLEAIALLEKISPYVCSAKDAFNKEIFGRGQNKKSKDDYNQLFYGICLFYKNVTNKTPKITNSGSSVLQERVIKGDILDVIKIILPYTSYKGSDTAGALEQRVNRIKRNAIYKEELGKNKKDK